MKNEPKGRERLQDKRSTQRPTPATKGAALVRRLKGRARKGLSTDEVLALTRG
jgi:hypothetical protein